MTAAVWFVLILYAVLGVAVAVASRRRLGEGVTEYYLAGRRVGGIVSALSYGATTYSAFMMVGLVGLTYAGGVGALGFELIYLSGLGLVVIFGPRFWLVGRRFGYVTPSEMLGDRYGSRALAAIVALASCVFLVPYSAVQLMGIGYLLSGASDGAVPFTAGILLGAAFTLVWTLVAGLRSVLWTDVLQVVIMLVTSLIAVGFVLAALGGVGGFIDTIESERGDWLTVPGPGLFDLKTFLALTLPWFFFSISNPQVSQRLYTTESLGAMRTMIAGFLLLGFVYTVVSVVFGFSALALLPGLDKPDLATARLIGSEVIPTAVAVVLMVGILAAAVSTVDSILLTLGAMVSHDVYRPWLGTDRRVSELLAGKLVVVVMTVIAVLFARLELDLISILSVASSTGLLVTVPAIVGAFFWRRGTAAGAISSILVAGIAVTVMQLGGYAPFGVPPAFWSAGLSVALFVAVSLMTPRRDRDRARAFIDELGAELDARGIR
ncbi:sodium:solute symporter family protein [Arhodomonas sp. SL1]|uniref:sodium:solute symporter family protein n=1 Tax=Arhodomonas sp. SL1 TaxID=3425691 RepID=UPI003F884CB3